MELVIYLLAAWRITSMFVNEKGPANIFGKLRKKAYLFTCFWCFSFWVGMLMSYFYIQPGFSIGQFLLYSLFFSAGSIFLEEIIGNLQETKIQNR